MIFETKKINTETLSEYLREVRQGLGLSLETAAEKTGVALKFLENLEAGKYQALPPDVYVVGFLKQIAQSYSIGATSLISQYKKERGIIEQVAKPQEESASKFKRYLKTVTVTPKLVSLAVAGIFITTTLGYLVWQVSSLSRPPSLRITSPVDNAKVLGTVVTVQGKTDKGTLLHINDQNVLVQGDGSFQTTVSLASGQTSLRLEAKNKFDHVTTKVIPLIVDQQAKVAGAQDALEENKVAVDLDFIRASTITITVDGQVLPQEAVSAGSTKFIQGKQNISVSASDGGAVRVKLNGNDLGLLGADGQPSVDIPFSLDSAQKVKKDKDTPAILDKKN